MEIADSTKAVPRRNPARIYAASHIASPSRESAERGFTLKAASAALSPEVSTLQENSAGFETFTYKK